MGEVMEGVVGRALLGADIVGPCTNSHVEMHLRGKRPLWLSTRYSHR